jgi:hypothetical protein
MSSAERKWAVRGCWRGEHIVVGDMIEEEYSVNKNEIDEESEDAQIIRGHEGRLCKRWI